MLLVSRHLWSPAPLAHQVLGPTVTAAGEVFPLGDQPLVELAGEQGDAVGARMMAKPMAGEADLSTAAGTQHALVEVRPVLNGLVA